MNKKFMVVGAGLLVAGGLAILALYFYWLRPVESAAPTYQQLAEHAASHGVVLPPPPPSAPQLARAAAPIDPQKPVRLAIGWLGLPDETQNGQAADLLLAQLSSARNLQLVDRQSLDKVLRESQMSLSGLVRAQSATRLGKLLRADWFLLGSAATVNGSNYVVVRIVDARTGTMLNAEIVSRQDGTSQLVPKLAAFVRQSRESASHPGKPRT